MDSTSPQHSASEADTLAGLSRSMTPLALDPRPADYESAAPSTADDGPAPPLQRSIQPNLFPDMPLRGSGIACESHTALSAETTLGEISTQPTAALRAFADAAKAPSTRRAYRHDWRSFETFCDAQGQNALPCPPGLLALYLTEMAHSGRKVAGIERALAAISQAYRTADLPSPRSHALVRSVLQGIRRTLGTRPNQKQPITITALRRLVDATPAEGLRGIRDRAVLLLCFAGAMRRGELVALDAGDIADDVSGQGLRVLLRRSKIDQEGRGREIGVPYGDHPDTCPVRALRAWTTAAAITGGPVFFGVTRHGHLTGKRLAGEDIGRLIKGYAGRVGLDAAKIGAHSLRAGLVTTAAGAGKAEHTIMRHTGHTSAETLRGYIRPLKLFEDNAAKGIGL